MAAVRRLALVRREIRERISATGLELLLRAASRISEGRIAADGRYYGSTMLTLDLGLASGQVRDVCDIATAVRLAQLLEGDAAALAQVRRLVVEEASRVARRPLGELELEIRLRVEGSKIFIDVDVEGPGAQARVAKRGG
jgi:hypothetical protein